MECKTNAWLERTRACLEVMGDNQKKFEAMDLESNREQINVAEEHQEICSKVDAVEIIGQNRFGLGKNFS
jgi:hypothetical protein